MISIITPTYNRAKLLPRMIQSLLSQSFKNWELIIVDDGSDDDSNKVVDKFLKDKRIKYIKKENTGAAHSRNVGVENARFEYITFLDSDDEAKPEWLEKIITVIKENRPALVCCGCEKIDYEGELIKVDLPEGKPAFFGKQDYKMIGGVFTVERKLFMDLGGYDDKLESGQHTELSFRLIPYILDSGLQINNIYESLVKIHIHKGERIRGNKKAKYLGSKRTLEKHATFFREKQAARSDYEGVVAYNAFLLGMKKEASEFAKKSFLTKPSIKRFLRIFKYVFLIKK